MAKYLDMPGLTYFYNQIKNKFASKTDVGAPTVASTVSAMTDHNKIYVYTGSESGYTTGNWYYYDAGSWKSGGVYNATAYVTDKTLSEADKPADAKATGDEISDLKSAVYKYTGNKEIPVKSGAYIALNGSTANINAPVASANSEYAVVQCVKGDIFTVSTTGGASGRAYGFISSSGEILQVAGASVTITEQVLTAPENAAYLIINAYNASIEAYYGKRLVEKVDDLSVAINDVKKTMFTIENLEIKEGAPRVYSRLLVAKTGGNKVDEKGCQVGYYQFDQPIMVSMTNPDYEIVCWVYSDKTISSAVYSPTKEYTTADNILTPLENADASYFKVGIIRVDGQNLTTDMSDTTSDAYKIKQSLIFYERYQAPSFRSVYTKKIAFFGDSLVWSRDGNSSSGAQSKYPVPATVAYNLGIPCINYAVGSQGYMHVSAAGEKAYDNIVSKDLSDVDIAILWYGENDNFFDLGVMDDTSETTILGQFNKCLSYLYTTYPTIRVIVFAPLNSITVGTAPDYWYGERNHPSGYVSRKILSDALKEQCDRHWIPYIEIYDSPLNPFNMPTAMPDGGHLSDEFYKQLGTWVSGKLRMYI